MMRRWFLAKRTTLGGAYARATTGRWRPGDHAGLRVRAPGGARERARHQRATGGATLTGKRGADK